MQNQRRPVPHTRLFVPKAFYFLYYAAGAALTPFIALYYQRLGLTGRQIGLLVGLPALITLFSAFIWGAFADATRQHKRVLLTAILGVALAVLLLSLARSFHILILLVTLYAFLSAPIMPLADNAVMDLLAERRNQYGKLRLWGAVGWGVAAPIVGLLTDAAGLRWIFYAYILLMLCNLALASRLPVSRGALGQPIWRGLRSLLMDRRWILFLVPVFIGSVSRAVTENFLFLYLEDLGADQTLMGFSLAVASVSELPIYFFSAYLLDRWGAKGLLAFSLLACVVRAAAFAAIGTPGLALPIQLLHGACFSAMQVAGVSYADALAPPGIGATAQGVFHGVIIGLATVFGALIGGALYQDLGGAVMFRWVSLIALVGLLVFALANIRSVSRRPVSACPDEP